MPKAKKRKRSILAPILALLLVLALAGTLLFSTFRDKIEHWEYPQRFTEYVEYYAGKYGIDPMILYADNDRTVHKGKVRPAPPGLVQCGVDAAQDLRLGDVCQGRRALRRGKCAVCQQAAAHRAVFVGNIRAEHLLQLCNAGRTGQQHFPRN